MLEKDIQTKTRRQVKWWVLETKSDPIRLRKQRERRKNASYEQKEARRIYLKEWREKNKDILREKHRLFRLNVLRLYSGSDEPFCKCCGEKELKFLSLDHTNGGGTFQRKELNTRGGNSFFFYLKKMGFPAGFQVLCHNCNMAKGMYGKCPHNEK